MPPLSPVLAGAGLGLGDGAKRSSKCLKDTADNQLRFGGPIVIDGVNELSGQSLNGNTTIEQFGRFRVCGTRGDGFAETLAMASRAGA